ncbi:MAG TPA: hypothetical protein VK074_03740, partial [Fodinibius sp.]|nr:hypothetical protein [Fodinibius sp.]
MIKIVYLLPLLFCLSLAVLSCRQDQSGTTVIQNVRGYTFYDDSLTEFGAIQFEEGKVVDVYRDSVFQRDAGIEVIDGKGRVMLPGLIDAHGHVMGLGFQQL